MNSNWSYSPETKSWVVTSVTLTFDLWPWPFAWTLPWSNVITPENFMMIRWWEHSQKGVTDGQTDRRTDGQTDRQTENTICRAAWSQLKIQERALRFVLKGSHSSYEEMLGNLEVDSIRMNGLKKLSIEIYKLLNGLSPDYLSTMSERSKNPYGVRDKNKLIQPIKKSTNNGLKSFQYFGAHVWNILPTDIKNSLSICEFKNLIKLWPGPSCNCTVCTLII